MTDDLRENYARAFGKSAGYGKRPALLLIDFVRGYFDRDLHPVPLGEHQVHHQHRTIEDQLRTFLAAGFSLTDLREVPGHDRDVPLYLDLLFARS